MVRLLRQHRTDLPQNPEQQFGRHRLNEMEFDSSLATFLLVRSHSVPRHRNQHRSFPQIHGTDFTSDAIPVHGRNPPHGISSAAQSAALSPLRVSLSFLNGSRVSFQAAFLSPSLRVQSVRPLSDDHAIVAAHDFHLANTLAQPGERLRVAPGRRGGRVMRFRGRAGTRLALNAVDELCADRPSVEVIVLVQLHLGVANAFLLVGQRAILVDCGRPGDGQRLRRLLLQQGIDPLDLSLILLTHAHWDHAGSARELKSWTPAVIAVHQADAAMLRRGDNGALRPTGLTGRLLRPFLDRRYQGIEADVAFDGPLDLWPYGVRGRAISTPGHTEGSISVITADGDAIVGDLMMGGYLGGKVCRGRPTVHYFAEDPVLLRASIQDLLRERPRLIYVGHGGPLAPAAVARAFGNPPGTREERTTATVQARRAD